MCVQPREHTLVIVEIRNELSQIECGGVKKWNAGQTGWWLLFNSGSDQVWVAPVRPLPRPLFLLCSPNSLSKWRISSGRHGSVWFGFVSEPLRLIRADWS